MKTTIIILALLIGGCGSDSKSTPTTKYTWSGAEQADYLLGCTNGGGTKSFCECSLTRFEDNYPSFSDAAAETDAAKLITILQGC